MKVGAAVIYVQDPLLYGEMEVAQVLKRGKVRCIIDPDGRTPGLEVFDADELDAPEPLAA